MTTKRFEVVTFAVDDEGETLIELRSHVYKRRRLRVIAKAWARQFGRPFAVGCYEQRAE